jgi:ferredoxin
MTTRVSIDPDLCIGSGDCARALPEAFEVDEAEGVAVPLAGAASTDTELLVRAARGCPSQAIRVVGDDGTLLYGEAP